MNLPDSRKSKHSAFKTPSSICPYFTHPKDIFPQRGQNTAKLLFCAAKLQKNIDTYKFWGKKMQKKWILLQFCVKV